MKDRWIKESRWFWTVLVSAFQKAGQQKVLERTLQPFNYGLYGDDSAKGVAGDCVLAYLVCTFHDEAFRSGVQGHG